IFDVSILASDVLIGLLVGIIFVFMLSSFVFIVMNFIFNIKGSDYSLDMILVEYLSLDHDVLNDKMVKLLFDIKTY
ncbi:MAG: hypothetical protein AAFO15_02770, partial [Pseudomonadota bacterium]